MPGSRYRLGDEVHDLTSRTLVMGILNRTPDSFYDHGATFELDSLLRRAAALVEQGADILDVGGVKAGPGPAFTPPTSRMSAPWSTSTAARRNSGSSSKVAPWS